MHLGSEGVWGAIFTVNIKKRVAQKLRRIIVLRFGLVPFRIHFRKARQLSFSLFSGVADVTMTPKTRYI